MSNLVKDIVMFMKMAEINTNMSGIEKKGRVIDSVKFKHQDADKALISAIIDNLISIEKGEINIHQAKKLFSHFKCCA